VRESRSRRRKEADFGFHQPGQFEDKVSEEIELALSIAGASAK